MPFGAELRADGRVRFRLWAPSHATVALELAEAASQLAMRRLEGGWHELVTDQARAGTCYRFVLPNGMRVPDPASRFQPEGVHGPSEVVDPAAHPWRDAPWAGRAWEEAVICELHIGTFTPEGSFRAVIGRLDHLAGLGVTVLEIMPVAAFAGRRGWGYDGVQPFAPHAPYGRPEDLKALVEAAHERNLMVLLDVVHNHLGPEGNYLPAIAAEAFSARHHTPWGPAPDFDGPGSAVMRDYVLHNALYWLEEFHLDGLRLDAVHAIRDDSPVHIVDELAARVRHALPHRQVHLVLEDAHNTATRLSRDASGRPRSGTAQWNDDLHHALHAAATGEAQGYYADFAGDTARLGRALAEGFAFQGGLLTRFGAPRGEPSAHLPPTAFIACIQNHDQVGNRARGERITELAPDAAVRAIAAVCLLLPQVPMLFMGQEWGAAQRFPFFCDLGPGFAEAVREGRRAEFAQFPDFADPDGIPDPLAESTFLAARLRWDDIAHAPHAAWLAWHRRILAVRQAEIIPRLPALRRGGTWRVLGDGAVAVRWSAEGWSLDLVANLSAAPVHDVAPAAGRVIWQEGEAVPSAVLAPLSVRWSVEEVA